MRVEVSRLLHPATRLFLFFANRPVAGIWTDTIARTDVLNLAAIEVKVLPTWAVCSAMKERFTTEIALAAKYFGAQIPTAVEAILIPSHGQKI